MVLCILIGILFYANLGFQFLIKSNSISFSWPDSTVTGNCRNCLCSVSSTETDIITWLAKAWTTIDWLSVICKSDLIDIMKPRFFQAAVISILLYGYTTWTLTKRMEKKLDSNYTRILRAILNKSWRQHPTKQQQLYGYLPPITKTIQVRWTRHAGHSWRSKEELISDILLWTPSHGRAKAGQPARTYIQQLCSDTECSLEGLPKVILFTNLGQDMTQGQFLSIV